MVEMKVESVGRAFKCVLETNRGEKLEYMPGYHRIREDIDTLDEKNETCTFCINKANDTHAGVWKVMAYTAKKENEENIDSFDDITPEVFLFSLYIRQVNLASYYRLAIFRLHVTNVRKFCEIDRRKRHAIYDRCFLYRFYNLLFPPPPQKKRRK